MIAADSNPLRSYLEQQRQLGIPDPILAPGERDAYMPPLNPGQSPGVPVSPATGSSAAVPADAPAVTPREREEKRTALKRIYRAVQTCRLCPLEGTRNRTVFGAGNAAARLLAIGEAPGADEDRQGMPFVGAAGRLLTKMLAAIDLDRTKDVFITNILKCRPPGNRNPESAEIARCLPYLRQQITIIRPAAILLLGRIAAHTLLDNSESIARLRGAPHRVDGIPAFVTYHPASLLRNPSYKSAAWKDLRKVRAYLDGKS